MVIIGKNFPGAEISEVHAMCYFIGLLDPIVNQVQASLGVGCLINIVV